MSDKEQKITKKEQSTALVPVKESEFSLSTYLSDAGVADKEVAKQTRKPVWWGLLLLLAVFGGFGFWASTAPIDSAAIAMGTVVVDSNRKTVQHLEGGIVGEILVREGDTVEVGQPLVVMDNTSAKTRAGIVNKKLYSNLALEARLKAERDNKGAISFPSELNAKRNIAEVKELIDVQKRLFSARRAAVSGQVNVLNKRVDQLNDEIAGLQSQSEATRSQLVLIEEEMKTVKRLVDRGYAVKPRLLGLQRQAADLQGDIGDYNSRVARANQTISEQDLEILNIKNAKQNEVIGELSLVQNEIADLMERQGAAEDVLERVTIAAPQGGVITALKIHTKGGVIQPGEPLMDIVPVADELMIDAKVLPQDIDVVFQDMDAKVRLSAYKARQVPLLPAKVLSVSADSFVDDYTGQPYYKARVQVSEQELNNLEGVALYPGMPAEVYVVTGSKTMLSYMMDPITSSFQRAFKEE